MKREIISLANNTKDNIDNMNIKIEEKKNGEQNILLNIGESFQKEINNANDFINEIKNEKEKSNLNFSNKIKEINEWIDNSFKK